MGATRRLAGGGGNPRGIDYERMGYVIFDGSGYQPEGWGVWLCYLRMG